MLSRLLMTLGICAALGAANLSLAQETDLVLRYDQPAQDWEKEALPLGNGRLGAMVFGGVEEERIALNEDTLWSGTPYDWNSDAGKELLPEIRRLVFARKFNEAGELCKKLQGAFTQSYQPLGNLRIEFADQGEITDYQRTLDIENAVATVEYRADGHWHRRRMFVSHPDQVLVVEIETEHPEGLTLLSVGMNSLLTHEVKTLDEGRLQMTGRAPVHVEPNYRGDIPKAIVETLPERGAGMTFAARVQVRQEGGQLGGPADQYAVRGAKRVVILLAADTSFNGFDKRPDQPKSEGGVDPTVQPRRQLEEIDDVSVEELFKRHCEAYQGLFNRVKLDLGEGHNVPKFIPQRLAAIRDGKADPALEALFFQYGRYLLISSSREGTQPANLQGIWSEKQRPPWSANYTTNINAEMNYWPVETTNLSECHLPLMQMIGELAVTGKQTAKTTYGMHGWTAHHNVDLWRLACPVGNFGEGDPTWANWQFGGAWLCQHLWEHFQFTQDKTFLRDKAYPVMRGAAEFLFDAFVLDAEGRYVSIPSTSPENAFKWTKKDGGNGVASVSAASTMDLMIAWDLFTNLIEASEVLGTAEEPYDAEFIEHVKEVRQRLLPLQIGRDGRLQEWSEDFADVDPHHRHVSHLFGLHPGRQLSPLTTPELAEAARRSLEIRGDGGTGWSKAWKINFWARLHDGDHAHKMLVEALAGNTYDNLLDAHPPFQIDGNFGATSGIAEMLLQSQLSTVDKKFLDILPALPSAWPRGSVSGLRARGNITVDLAWEDGKPTSVRLTSKTAQSVRLRFTTMKEGSYETDLALPAEQTVDAVAEFRSVQELFKLIETGE